MSEASMPSAQPAVGPQLAELRQQRALGLHEVSQRLRFSIRQLEALESGRYDALPDMTFVRGMIRSYARFLETDPEPLIHGLELERPDAVPRLMASPSLTMSPQGVGFFRETHSTSKRWVLAGILVLVVALVVAWLWHEDAAPPDTTPASQNAAPASQDTGSVPVPPNRPPEP